MINKINRGSKGSITVEAAVIVPVVILSVIAVIYLSIIIYQKAYIQSLADRAAENGSVMWRNIGCDMEIGKVKKEDLGKEGLYWRIIDTNKGTKQDSVKAYIDSRINRYSIIQEKDIKTTVELKNYVVYKKLLVNIESTYRIPVSGLLSIFGFSSDYTIRARSESVIDEPAEFIRNTDFILDIERELENKYPKLKDIGEKTREVISSTNTKIEEFFN